MASIIDNFEGFNWDEGNSGKNWHLHRVTDSEAEEVFFSEPIIIVRDSTHSNLENRYVACGVTSSGRRLTVIFTMRNTLIRVISARDMTLREDGMYEERIKRNS
jgi:uncharacterized protein